MPARYGGCAGKAYHQYAESAGEEQVFTNKVFLFFFTETFHKYPEQEYRLVAGPFFQYAETYLRIIASKVYGHAEPQYRGFAGQIVRYSE